MTGVTDRSARFGVRRYAESDAAACCAVVRSAVRQMSGMHDAARALIIAHATPAALGDELASFLSVVAEADGDIVGVGALDGGEIKRVYVHPLMQGRGIGRAVMAALEREAQCNGLVAVYVVAGTDATPFYERLRYARLEAGEHVLGGVRIPFVTMRKSLGEGTNGA